MEQKLLQAWRTQAAWLWLMLPLSWLYGLIFWLNKNLYRLGLKNIYYAKVPVIVVGNITVGGSGKTPLIIAVVQYLRQQGIKVGVISRGYGGQTQMMPCIVTVHSQPSEVGDEPCLIFQRTGVPMAVCPNRGKAIDLLLQQFADIQLILSDDGLQHFALDRDENWVIVDVDRGLGNQQLLPTGFLREPINRLQQAHTSVIFHQSDWQAVTSYQVLLNSLSKKTAKHFPDIRMRLVEQPIEPLFNLANHLASHAAYNISSKKVIAMTGIGYPQRFFNSLSKLGFEVITMPFNDHHQYSRQDFADLPDLPIIVTDKDAVKLRVLFNQNPVELQNLAQKIWVLPVKAELSPSLYALIDKQVNHLIKS